MSHHVLKWGLLGAAAVGALAVGQTASAAGFQLKEQGGGLQGHSFAGASAKADDLSTIFFNPAGLSRIEGTQGEVTVSGIAPSAEFSLDSVSGGGFNALTASDGNGGDAGVPALVPAMYAAYDVNDDWNIGVGINSPFGLSTEYKDGWVGRFHALKSELMTISLTTVASYKVNDRLSVGAGPVVQYIEGELTKAINFQGLAGSGGEGKSVLNANDVGVGFTAGILYEYDENSRVGFSYRSRVNHRLDGEIEIQGTVPGALSALDAFQSRNASARITTPDILSVGGYHALNDQWALLGEVAYTNWSVFNELRVIDDNGVVRELVDENWHDTVFISAGTEFRMNDAATFQFGVAYDQGAADTKDLTFRIPDSDRLWVSAGFSYDFSENTSMSVGYSHIFADKATVTEEQTTGAQGTVSGTFDSSVDILALNLAMKF